MLSFEERMKLLDAALEAYTPETLLAELSSFPAYGDSLAASYVACVSEKVTVIEPCNLFASNPCESTYSFDDEYNEAA